MTDLLKKAISKAEQLADDDQDRLALFLLAEIVSEQKWSEAFDRSQRELSRLAEEAIEECGRGN